MNIIPLHAFSDNFIWLLRAGSHAAVVDPGDAAPVLRYLTEHGLALTAILVTHHHPDHVAGIAGNAALPPLERAMAAIPLLALDVRSRSHLISLFR